MPSVRFFASSEISQKMFFLELQKIFLVAQNVNGKKGPLGEVQNFFHRNFEDRDGDSLLLHYNTYAKKKEFIIKCKVYFL